MLQRSLSAFFFEPKLIFGESDDDNDRRDSDIKNVFMNRSGQIKFIKQ